MSKPLPIISSSSLLLLGVMTAPRTDWPPSPLEKEWLQARTWLPKWAGCLTFFPGTCYTHASAISIGGLNPIVTLDGGGDENAAFIFIAGSTVTTSPLSQIGLQNGAKAKNFFWVIGTTLAVDNGSIMVVTFLVGTMVVTIGENRKIWGQVIAQTTVACYGCIGVEIPIATSTWVI